MTELLARPVADLLDRVHLGPRQAHKALTLWPLLRPDSGSGPDYVPLCDALEDGFVGVDGPDERSPVEAVRVENRGGRPVLVIAGERLHGAGQDRAAPTSFLVPGRGEAWIDAPRVPVGRPAGRRAHVFRPLDAQVGFVAAIGEQVLGVEVIGRPEVFGRVFDLLLDPYAIDAMGSLRRPPDPVARFDAPEPFLVELCAASLRPAEPSAGPGANLRLRTGALQGWALTVEGHLIHLRAASRRPLGRPSSG